MLEIAHLALKRFPFMCNRYTVIHFALKNKAGSKKYAVFTKLKVSFFVNISKTRRIVQKLKQSITIGIKNSTILFELCL